MENRLHRAEAILKTVLPNIDLNDPNLSIVSPQERSLAPAVEPPPIPQPAPLELPIQGQHAEKDSLLESMVQHTGSLDLDDQGHWDFHGHSSGMVFLQRIRQQLGDLMGEPEGHGSALAKPRHFTPPPQVFESPRASESPGDPTLSLTADLPTKECALEFCEVALDDACALMRFVHQPTFFTMFHRIYDKPPDQWDNEEHRYLPLLYGLMSVGSMFAKHPNSRLGTEGYTRIIDYGYVQLVSPPSILSTITWSNLHVSRVSL